MSARNIIESIGRVPRPRSGTALAVLCVFAVSAVLLSGCRDRGPRHTVQFRVAVPPSAQDDRLFITGSHSTLGEWNAAAVPLQRIADTLWAVQCALPQGTALEYKFTRGSWNNVELDQRGVQYASNRQLAVAADTIVDCRVIGWIDRNGGETRLTAKEIRDVTGFWLTNGWRYHPGDDSAWAGHHFDDSGWEVINSNMSKNGMPSGGWNGIGWFRLTVKIDSALQAQSLAFHLWQIGASDVYLDGQLLYRFGTVGTSALDEKPYEDRNPRLLKFPQGERHVIAVRYSNHEAAYYEKIGLETGFQLLLGDLNTYIARRADNVRETTIQQMVYTSIQLSLAMLHFFLFIFYPRFRENLYYSICLLGFAGITYAGMQGIHTTSAAQVVVISTIARIAKLIAIVFGQLLFYELALGRLPKRMHAFFAGGALLAIWTVLYPFGASGSTGDVFLVIAMAEMFRTAVMEKGQEREGAWIVGLGFIALVVTVSYEMLVSYRVIHPLFNFHLSYVYGALALSISMSIYLSRRFARTNLDLERRLAQVEELSAQAIEQERQAREAEIERRLLASENDRKSQELDAARQIQLSFLPKDLPRVYGLDIAVSMRTATEVGGDYYDFFVGTDGMLTLALGDATGHGAKAGIMVAVTKGLFHELAVLLDVGKILSRFNKAFREMRLGSIFMALVLLKIKDGKMIMTSAGMPPVLIYRAKLGAVEEIVLKGMPLGAFADFPYQQTQRYLGPGDVVVVMSDGLLEASNENREMLELMRVKDALRESAHHSAAGVVDALQETATNWLNGRPPQDDMTFIVIKVQPPGGAQ